MAIVTLAFSLPYCLAGKDPSPKDGHVGVSKGLDKKLKCPHIVERENKMNWDSFSQMVGIEKSSSDISAAEATTQKHCIESCKHCQENIVYGDEVNKPHVGDRIKRISNVDWSKMK